MNSVDLQQRFKIAPISINCQLGDGFQPTQWSGTKRRLKDLQRTEHKGPVAIITKSIITESQIEWLRDNVTNLNLLIYFSITGLTEKYGTHTILGNFIDVSTKCPNVKTVVFIRPIIPGQNDNIEILKPIIETAAKYAYNGAIIYRGYKDIENNNKNVKLNDTFIEDFENYCLKCGARVYPKTRMLACDAGIPHIMNEEKLSESGILDFLSITGYYTVFARREGKLVPINDKRRVTRGDIHFVEMFTGWSVDMGDAKYRDQRSILSIELFGKKNIDATSSWLGWGENKPCTIGCPYCIAFAEKKDYDYFGCNFDEIMDDYIAEIKKNNLPE